MTSLNLGGTHFHPFSSIFHFQDCWRKSKLHWPYPNDQDVRDPQRRQRHLVVELVAPWDLGWWHDLKKWCNGNKTERKSLLQIWWWYYLLEHMHWKPRVFEVLPNHACVWHPKQLEHFLSSLRKGQKDPWQTMDGMAPSSTFLRLTPTLCIPRAQFDGHLLT